MLKPGEHRRGCPLNSPCAPCSTTTPLTTSQAAAARCTTARRCGCFSGSAALPDTVPIALSLPALPRPLLFAHILPHRIADQRRIRKHLLPRRLGKRIAEPQTLCNTLRLPFRIGFIAQPDWVPSPSGKTPCRWSRRPFNTSPRSKEASPRSHLTFRLKSPMVFLHTSSVRDGKLPHPALQQRWL